jgi:phospholipase/carboxylesterase
MGSVMSYALGLGADRPAPAGILACSGFVPIVDGWRPDLEGRGGLRAFIAHGTRDPVIGIEFAHRARDLLQAGGIEVEYHESNGVHQIDRRHVPAAVNWLGESPPRDDSDGRRPAGRVPQTGSVPPA